LPPLVPTYKTIGAAFWGNDDCDTDKKNYRIRCGKPTNGGCIKLEAHTSQMGTTLMHRAVKHRAESAKLDTFRRCRAQDFTYGLRF